MATVPGELTFSINRRLVDEVVLVGDDEIRDALRFVFDRMKLVLEPSGATGVAALLAGRVAAGAGADRGDPVRRERGLAAVRRAGDCLSLSRPAPSPPGRGTGRPAGGRGAGAAHRPMSCSQAQVSATVSPIGRSRRPAARARPTSPRCMKSWSSPGGSQIGRSVQGSMPAARIVAGSVQRSSARPPVDGVRGAEQLAHGGVAGRADQVVRAGQAGSRRRPGRTAARSRASMYCSGRSAGPGARVGPPRARRSSHQGSRPTSSPGPRMRPARASRTGPSKSRVASSPPRLSAGYVVAAASGSASTTGESSVSGGVAPSA